MRDYKDVMRDLKDANSRALKGDFSGKNKVSDSEISYLMQDERMDIDGSTDKLMNEIGLKTRRTEGQI